MQFLVVNNDGTRTVKGNPGWRTGDTPEDARELTDDELVDHGFGLKLIDQPPAFDPMRQVLSVNPIADWVVDDRTATKTYTLTDLPLEVVRAETLARLADRRWQAETGGVILNGAPVKTDRDTQTKLTAAYVKADKNPDFSIQNWKVADGVFVTLGASTIIATGDAVTAHVQACFDKEASLTATIMGATTVDVLLAIDIESGWPA